MTEHLCDPMKEALSLPHDGYGHAIEGGPIYGEDDGYWTVGNGEYGSVIFYCPFCGKKLEKPE
jgi:hypothetical protein